MECVHCTEIGASNETCRARFKTSKGKWWFMQQVLGVWNLLPREVVRVRSLHGFKRKLDNFAQEKSSED